MDQPEEIRHAKAEEPSLVASYKPAGIENGIDVSTKNRTWRSYLWDTWDKSPEERRLVRKIDLTLVVFGFLGTFTKFIDKVNLQTAFVSGMREELGFYGNELNYANTAYNVGMVVALWPSSLILVRVKTKWFLPTIQLGWTICTFAQSRMQTTTHMYVLRVMVGIFSTSHYSSLMFLAGSWYQQGELARRLALINTASQIGPMVNSYLQSAAYSTLNNVQGLSGWRWLMIIDGIISLVVCIPQYFLLPEVPANLTPNFMFSEAEIQLAQDRQPKEGRVKQGAFTKVQMARWFTIPEVWILWMISVCNMIGMQATLSLNFWFKGWNTVKPGSFTVPQINNYTTPVYAMTLLTTVALAWISDTLLKGRRWPPMVFACTLNFIVCIILAATPVYPQNRVFRWFLYYNSGWGASANCMFWAWTTEILRGDPATRSFALAGLNVWGAVAVATIPLAVFKTVDQPAVVSGNYTSAAFLLLQAFLAAGLAFLLHLKEQRNKRHDGDDDLTESSKSVKGDGVIADAKR